MSKESEPQEEVFVVPRDEETFYLYTPLRRAVAVVNEAGVSTIARYLEKGEKSLNTQQQGFLSSLKKRGMLGKPVPKPPVFGKDYVFCPHEVTLFLTSRCNLRCRYCYADAGKKSVDMSWEVARSAIDFVSSNAGLLGSPKFSVGFHGGGEPTLAWDFLVRCVDYAHEKAENMGLNVDVFAATNGLLTHEQRRYITEKFTTVNVSLDGPADIQNFNRQKVNGDGSYQEVVETLKYFDERKFFYGIRSTITAETVERMEEIVAWIHSEFKTAYLHLEPIWLCGRCAATGARKPSDDLFIQYYTAAAAMGRRLGIDVHYSGARLDILTSKFCAAPGDNFTVLPEGLVTTCFEITEETDTRAEIFHYGRYDSQRGEFVFDKGRIAALQKLSVEHIPFCSDCFCKWHCAGDCLAKVFQESGATRHEGSSRCRLNRSLTLVGLEEMVQQVKAEKSN